MIEDKTRKEQLNETLQNEQIRRAQIQNSLEQKKKGSSKGKIVVSVGKGFVRVLEKM
jgi:hypothetical protein